MINTFVCKDGKKSWAGTVTQLKNYGSHYEFNILSRSSIRVILGESSSGHFACMPDFNAGCHLARLNDVFWNKERLTSALGKIDGITVAYALCFLAEKIRYPEF